MHGYVLQETLTPGHRQISKELEREKRLQYFEQKKSASSQHECKPPQAAMQRANSIGMSYEVGFDNTLCPFYDFEFYRSCMS